MTPKEKALELLNKYLCIDDDIDLFCDECGMSEEAAKQCALIAVDEILDTLKRNSTEFRGCMDFQLIAWWKEVKQEIIIL